MAQCPDCNGSGREFRFGGPRSGSSTCSTCSGKGKVPGRSRSSGSACGTCGGSGRQLVFGGPGGRRTCSMCGGSGRDSSGTRTKPASTARKPPASGLAEELAKLAQLHALGVLTDAEFRQAKAKLLGS